MSTYSGMYNSSWGGPTVYPALNQSSIINQPLLPANLAKHPHQWTRDEVSVWLKWCIEEFAIDSVPPDKFDMNGKALCLLERSDFMERVPKNGDVLFNALQKLIRKGQGSILCQQIPYIPQCSVNYPPFQHHGNTDNVPQSGLVFFSSATSKPNLTTTSSPPRGILNSSTDTQTSTVQATMKSLGRPFVPILPHPQRPSQQPCQSDMSCFNTVNSVPGILSPAPSADTESASDDDIEDHTHEDIKMNIIDIPPNGLTTDVSPIYRKQESDCRLLWEFIHQLLQDPSYSNFVCWENKNDFVFRIINPTGLAELWGHQKNRTNMTYEKLSRALRYYYRMNIIKKVSGKRLTYKFMQPPNNIQKGQRGAKPHNKALPPRSPLELCNGSEGMSNHSDNSPSYNNFPSKGPFHRELEKALRLNGSVIKSEPMEIPSSGEGMFKNPESTSSPNTTPSISPSTPKQSELSPNGVHISECLGVYNYPGSVTKTTDIGIRTSPKQAHAVSPVIKTEPFFISRPTPCKTLGGFMGEGPNTTPSISPSIPKQSELSPNGVHISECLGVYNYPGSIPKTIDMDIRTSPRQAHSISPVIKTEPFFNSKPTSCKSLGGFMGEEPQDFTMTTLKRKQRESLDSDSDTKRCNSPDTENHLNLNFTLNAS